MGQNGSRFDGGKWSVSGQRSAGAQRSIGGETGISGQWSIGRIGRGWLNPGDDGLAATPGGETFGAVVSDRCDEETSAATTKPD